MGKKLNGVWHQGHVLCPKCLVKPEKIRDYGADQKGYWFTALCPHCRLEVRWYRDQNFSGDVALAAEGEQLSLEVSRAVGKKRTGDNTLIFRY